MDNILVLGDGLLGQELVKQTNSDYISRSNNNIDILHIKQWSHLIKNSYDTVINCIAYTDTYGLDMQTAWDVNLIALNDLIDVCNNTNKKLIHISTDYIYAGSVSNASEQDVPVHLPTWYGYTKLVGDALVQLRSNDYLICRLSHKPNPYPYDNGWIDMRTNCDSVDVICNLIIDLIKKQATGVYNIGTESKTIYDLAIKTNKNIVASNKPKHVPADVTMNINKLKTFLK
jgi:dTDP-4-dehydrorhamnose reductase